MGESSLSDDEDDDEEEVVTAGRRAGLDEEAELKGKKDEPKTEQKGERSFVKPMCAQIET